MTNNNLEQKQEFDFNRVNFNIIDFGRTDFFSLQVVINAYCYQLERTNTGQVYHRPPGYCDLNIEQTGFKVDTGYVWIALESGITIASNGGSVKYVATNWLTNKEYFFDDYDKAIEKRAELRKWAKDAHSLRKDFGTLTSETNEHQRVVR